MALMEGFTRPEVIRLTSLSSSRLAYFDRQKLVAPAKYGTSKKPTCIYSWEQILELFAIKDLNRKVSLQTIRQILENFEKMGFSEQLRDKHLVVVGKDVFWAENNWKDFPEKMLKVSDR
ncbi:MAG: MerR family transcriptional regulator, partial [Acidobacteriota bacterium]